MSVTWPLPATGWTAGVGVTSAQMRLLAEAFNDVLNRLPNDRLIRTAKGPVARGAILYSVSLTEVSATLPADAQDPLGYALSDAADGGQVHVLRSGELEITIAGDLLQDYIADLDNAMPGEAVVYWVETVGNTRTAYTAPISTYNRRRRRRRSSDNDNTIDVSGWRIIGHQTRYKAKGGTFRTVVWLRPDGTKYESHPA